MNSSIQTLPAAGLVAAFLLLSPAGAQQTERISLDSAGQQGGEPSYDAAISADGRFVAFRSYSDNLVSGDTNVAADVFVRDRLTGTTERISVDSAGQQANSSSLFPAISADGRYVAFISRASNLVAGDLNSSTDVFLRDRQTGLTTLVSANAAGVPGNAASYDPSISADGLCIAFDSRASDLVPGDTNTFPDVFLLDRTSGLLSRLSVDSAGAQGTDASRSAALSADGRYAAFESDASNLVAGDLNGCRDVFMRDRQTGLTSRVSLNTLGGEGNGPSGEPAISADGRFVAFDSAARNLVQHDSNRQDDVFVRDLTAGRTARVSEDSAGRPGNRGSNEPAISADGRFVAFRSGATDLVPGDGNGTVDVFLHDHQTGEIVRVSVGAAGAEGDGASYSPALSADGRYTAFYSFAGNLVPGDTNGARDAFVHDREGGGLRLARSGSCPGVLRLTITQATPRGAVMLAYGPAGTFVHSGTPCTGLTLSIGNPVLRGPLHADAAGTLTILTQSLSGVCGLTLQAVDVRSCAVSNVVVL